MVSHAVQPSPLICTLKWFELERILSVLGYHHLTKLRKGKYMCIYKHFYNVIIIIR